MNFFKKTMFISSFISCVASCEAQTVLLNLGFPLPIDTSRFKENKLNRVALKYYIYNSTDDKFSSKRKNEVKAIWFSKEHNVLQMIGFFESSNKIGVDFFVSVGNYIIQKFYTETKLYKVDVLDESNKLVGMYLYTYNEYKLLNKIFLYEFDGNNNLFLAEKIVLIYR